MTEGRSVRLSAIAAGASRCTRVPLRAMSEMRPVHIVGAHRRAVEAMDRARYREAADRSSSGTAWCAHPKERAGRVVVTAERSVVPLRR